MARTTGGIFSTQHGSSLRRRPPRQELISTAFSVSSYICPGVSCSYPSLGPEYVTSYKEQLCSDAFSQFDADPDRKQHFSAIKNATLDLRQKVHTYLKTPTPVLTALQVIPDLAIHLLGTVNATKTLPPGISLRSSSSIKTFLEAGVLKEEFAADRVCKPYTFKLNLLS